MTQLLCAFLIAQGVALCVRADPLVRFTHLTPDDGLSDGTVSAIVEDFRGFMWFGTDDGLNRFDGYSFAVYRNQPGHPGSLVHNMVLALAEDQRRTLWVGTVNGLARYDRDNDAFVTVDMDEEAAAGGERTVRAILQDEVGDLWFATSQGLYRYDPSDETFVRYLPDDGEPRRGPSVAQIFSLARDRGGLWVGTLDAGLNRWDRETDTFVHYRHDPGDPRSLSDDRVRDLFVDSDGTVWIATFQGLNRFDPETGVFTRYRDAEGAARELVTAVEGDHHGRLWLGTDGAGLVLFDPEGTSTGHLHDPADETTLHSNVVRTIYEDSKGDLWVGTFTRGVSYANDAGQAFTHYHHQPDDPRGLRHSSVLAILDESREGGGAVWLGTEGGLHRFDPAAETFEVERHDPRDPSSLSGDAVLAVLRDARGDLWVGTYAHGLNRRRPDGGFDHYLPGGPDRLAHGDVWDLHEDGGGRLWIATSLGVDRLEEDRRTFVHYPHDPRNPRTVGHDSVRQFEEDGQGGLWVATLGGLSVYDPAVDTFQTWHHDPDDPASLSNDQVLAVFEDRRGRLWVGTGGGGLNLFDRATGTFSALGTADGLASGTVRAIAEDDLGALWLGTNAGLSKLDPEKRLVTNYDKGDGMMAGPVNRNAVLVSRSSGILLAGGIDGLVVCDPRQIRENTLVPPVVLTDFQVFNQPVPIGEDRPLKKQITEARRITLRHDQSVITLGYAALNFRAPEKNRYMFRLEGFDDDWRRVGSERSVTYTNLDPKTYTFHVRGSNNSGVWNEVGTSVEIEVLPPYWQTWWFRILALLGVGAILWGGYESRTRAIRSRNEALEAEVRERLHVETMLEKLLDGMAQKNATLTAQNAELERFNYTVSHDLKSPLITVKGFLGMLRQDLREGRTARVDEDLERIEDAAEKMHRVVVDLLELSRVGHQVNPAEPVPLSEIVAEAAEMVAGSVRERGVAVDAEEGMPVVLADRVRVREVFQNLLENAIKFMGEQGEPRVEVGARRLGEEVECFVRDNGRGIAAAYQNKVFGLFERLHTDVEGTGLGLALVKRIVEVHGGRIWVESDGPGQGTTFYFTLPAA